MRWLLTAAQVYLGTLDESLGKSAEVSGSKMRYQMDRLRRLAATYELNKEASLRKHAEAMTLHLFPEGHPQERVIAGAWFLGAYGGGTPGSCGSGAALHCLLAEEAGNSVSGHRHPTLVLPRTANWEAWF